MTSAPLLGEDVLTALVALVGLAGLLALGEGLRAWGVSARTTRRIVHAGVGLFVASTPFLFTGPLPVYGLAAVFTVVNTGARSRQLWAGIHEARPQSWGTVAMPLSVLPALAATWSVSPDRILAFQTAYLVLALADPVASWIGEGSPDDSRPDGSTIPGSLAFAASTFALTASMLVVNEVPLGLVLTAAVGTTLVATLVESVSFRGWDNLFIVAAVVLVLVPIQEQFLSPLSLGLALVAGAAFAGLAYSANALDGRGAMTGGLFAASLVGLGGGPWIVPGLVFFGSSSAVTGVEWEGLLLSDESPRRTQAQVLANGGVAWTALAVAALVPEMRLWGYAAFIGALSAAAADTWATELGRLAPAPPWSLRDGRRVPTGTSGAVSGVGTGAAVLGASSVVGAALLLDGPLGGWVEWRAALLVGAGVMGMMIDGVAGAFLQAQYRDAPSEGWVEAPPSATAVPERGWRGIGNNVVNLIGTTTGALVALTGAIGLG